MWVTKLLISPAKIRIFCPKRTKLGRDWHFCSFWDRPCRLIWCPVDGLVGGCGARAVSRKTPIYFIFYLLILFVLFLIILLSRSVVGEVICQRSGVRDRGGSAEVSRVVDFDF